MMYTNIIVIIIFILSTIQPKSYNILAIDGGGIRGIISAECIKEIELYAYSYAVKKNYDIPRHRNNQRMHMMDLFDMMAGTSTGSILSAGLSIPSK